VWRLWLACLLGGAAAADDADASGEVALRIIVVRTRERAQVIEETLKAGGDFAALAREASIDRSARGGGDLGRVPLESVRPELRDAVRGLAIGQRTGIVALPTGYAIVELTSGDEGAGEEGARRGAGGGVQFAGLRYPPGTAGAVDIEAFFRAMPKPEGWNDDLGLFCAIHKETVDLAAARLSELLDDPDIESKMQPRDLWHALYTRALVESYQGRMAQAIGYWEDGYRLALRALPENVAMMEEVLGGAYFHKAEMDNGLYDRPDDRCLFPPAASARPARFAQTADSEKAIAYLSRSLERQPDAPGVRWLLNLAYHTLGEYPDGVPAAHRIPPSVFASAKDIGRFTDVAGPAGLAPRTFMSAALVADDFDGDGLIDVMTSSYDSCDHVHYFHNEGNGTFADRSTPSALSKVVGGQGLFQADYDNDGCLDLLVLRGAWQVPMPVSLVRNNCDGTFREVTEEAGLRGRRYATQIGVWADFDGDGWLDVFIGDEQGPSQLFRNLGSGRFENVSARAGVDRTSFVKGAVADDYDGDGYPDLFVSNIRGDNFLYHNEGNGAFAEVAEKAGVRTSHASFTSWFFDYDNDGASDLFVASDYASVDETVRTYLRLPNKAEGTSKLYRNRGDGTFDDVTVRVGLNQVLMPMGANFGDADGDGYLDIYLGNGAPDWGALALKSLYRNDEGRGFTDVAVSSGTSELHKAHGIAFADFENRGSQDLVVSMGGASPGDAHAIRLFRNPGNENDWLGLKLVGRKANRSAIGARLTLTVASRGGPRRTIHRTVTSGGSFGASPLAPQIGLGRQARILSLEIVWPGSRTRQRFENVTVNQFHEIEETSRRPRRLERKAYRLRGAPAAGTMARTSASAGEAR
jgi:hypothetical protein